jgi:hypothetical protein
MSNFRKWFLSFVVLLAVCSMKSAQAAPEKSAQPPARAAVAPVKKDQPQPEKTVLPAGTKISLELAEQLKSGDSKVGQTVHYFVQGDVTDDHGRILIKNGAPAFGTVTKSKDHGHFGRKGKLEFTVDYVTAVDGTHIPLRATQEINGKSHTAAVVVGMVFLSVFSGFLKGKNVVVKQGTLIPAYADSNVAITTGPPVTAPAPIPSAAPPAQPEKKPDNGNK